MCPTNAFGGDNSGLHRICVPLSASCFYTASDTIEQFSSEMIKAIIQDLSHHHQRLANRTRYRKIICQIACRGAVTCIQEGKEKEAQESTVADNITPTV